MRPPSGLPARANEWDSAESAGSRRFQWSGIEADDEPIAVAGFESDLQNCPYPENRYRLPREPFSFESCESRQMYVCNPARKDLLVTRRTFRAGAGSVAALFSAAHKIEGRWKRPSRRQNRLGREPDRRWKQRSRGRSPVFRPIRFESSSAFRNRSSGTESGSSRLHIV